MASWLLRDELKERSLSRGKMATMRHAHTLRVGVGSPEPKHVITHREGPTVAFKLRDDQQVRVVLQALDDEDNPADVTFAWSSDDETIASVTDTGGGNATIVASPGAGGLGTTTIHGLVTNNSNGDTVDATLDVEVVGGDARVVNIVPGEAFAKGL